MGLFVEESGLYEWDDNKRHYVMPGTDSTCVNFLSAELRDYYNFKTSDGSFDREDLPHNLREEVKSFGKYGHSLSGLNDKIGSVNINISINQLLADIIRSGAVFNNSLPVEGDS